jgi:hypothetical protein
MNDLRPSEFKMILGKNQIYVQHSGLEIISVRAAGDYRRLDPQAFTDRERKKIVKQIEKKIGRKAIKPIEVEHARYYIPLPAGWEMQTKGKGSTFRLAKIFNDIEYKRWAVLDEHLHAPLEMMARNIHDFCMLMPSEEELINWEEACKIAANQYQYGQERDFWIHQIGQISSLRQKLYPAENKDA